MKIESKESLFQEKPVNLYIKDWCFVQDTVILRKDIYWEYNTVWEKTYTYKLWNKWLEKIWESSFSTN